MAVFVDGSSIVEKKAAQKQQERVGTPDANRTDAKASLLGLRA
jgi:hypothetical protein